MNFENSVRFPAPRLHPFCRLLVCVVGCLVVQFAVMLVVWAATAVVATARNLDPTVQVNRFMSENLLLMTLFTYPPTLLWLWVCRRFLDRRAFISLGLRARGFFSQFLGGALCGFLACALIFGVLVVTGLARVTGWSLEAQSGGWERAFTALLGWAFAMLCVGFMEEVAFRGYALHNLNAWLGARIAVAVQAMAFAFVHLGNLAMQEKSTPDAALASLLAMPNITLIGIFFALVYFKTGSLWFPIAFHVAWNFFLGSVFSFPVSGIPIFRLFDVEVVGSTPLTGGSFGPEASVLLTPILLFLCFVIARAPDHFAALFDLKSLQPGAAMADEVLLESAVAAETEDRQSRFKTRMGRATHELDPETMAMLRALNEQNRKREPDSTFAVAVEPAQQAEPARIEPATTPPEAKVIPQNTAASEPSTPLAIEAETPVSQPAPPQSSISTSAPPATAPRESGESKSISPRKPKPRW